MCSNEAPGIGRRSVSQSVKHSFYSFSKLLISIQLLGLEIYRADSPTNEIQSVVIN